MRITNSTYCYGIVAIGFHWLMALGIFFLFGLGLYMTELGYYDPWYHKAPDLHKALGMLLVLLLLLRVPWRFINPVPVLHGNALERLAARTVHGLHYVLMIIVLFSGYLIPTADGNAIDVFGLIDIPALFGLTGKQEDLAGQVHWLSAWLIVVLGVIHGLAALKHHVLDKDDTLMRMLRSNHREADSSPNGETS